MPSPALAGGLSCCVGREAGHESPSSPAERRVSHWRLSPRANLGLPAGPGSGAWEGQESRKLGVCPLPASGPGVGQEGSRGQGADFQRCQERVQEATGGCWTLGAGSRKGICPSEPQLLGV